eukprot:749275-Rhodomonas_salina.1
MAMTITPRRESYWRYAAWPICYALPTLSGTEYAYATLRAVRYWRSACSHLPVSGTDGAYGAMEGGRVPPLGGRCKRVQAVRAADRGRIREDDGGDRLENLCV